MTLSPAWTWPLPWSGWTWPSPPLTLTSGVSIVEQAYAGVAALLKTASPTPTTATTATIARIGVRRRWSVVCSAGRRRAVSRRPARLVPVGPVLVEDGWPPFLGGLRESVTGCAPGQGTHGAGDGSAAATPRGVRDVPRRVAPPACARACEGMPGLAVLRPRARGLARAGPQAGARFPARVALRDDPARGCVPRPLEESPGAAGRARRPITVGPATRPRIGRIAGVGVGVPNTGPGPPSCWPARPARLRSRYGSLSQVRTSGRVSPKKRRAARTPTNSAASG